MPLLDISRPFTVLRSSTAQSCLPVLRTVLAQLTADSPLLLFCLAYAPDALVPRDTPARVFDWTGNVPGYADAYFDPARAILAAAHDQAASAPAPFALVIDSIDALPAGSATYTFLAALLAHHASCRLVVHTAGARAPLLAQIAGARFSPALLTLSAYPCALVGHIARAYLTPPPPLAPPEKFWRVFLPLADRPREVDALVHGREGEGGAAHAEFVMEVLARGGRTKGVERQLFGWNEQGACDLKDLVALKPLFSKGVYKDEKTADPTANISFNLNLTPSQQQSRAQVPLPYAHEGKPPSQATPAAIYYDPDSADDIDDDDPDEDLDI